MAFTTESPLVDFVFMGDSPSFGALVAQPRFGHLPNVIFEIFNEPIFQLWNETIKPYHEKIVSEPLLQITPVAGFGSMELGVS